MFTELVFDIFFPHLSSFIFNSHTLILSFFLSDIKHDAKHTAKNECYLIVLSLCECFFFRGTPRLFHAINIPRTRRPITFLLSPHVILFSVMCHIYAIFIRFPFNNNNNNNNIKTHKVPHSFSANIDKLPQYSRQHTLVLVALEMYIVISNMHPPRFRFVDDKFGYRLGITSRPF